MMKRCLFSVCPVSRFQQNLGALLFFFILATSVHAQQFPDTIWVPVTFYDFRSDESNPEFEVDHNGGLKRGMVADTLDANRKPVLGSKPFFNYYIHKWFMPWAEGDFTIPVYSDREGVKVTFKTVDYDTAFKNIVIQDSLPFLHIGDGVYQFERSGNNRTTEFFWIDRIGFGNEKKNHNYSFTMELHSTFTYNRDLIFEFLGDDDVWAFINGKLAMDIGGIHGAEAGEIELNEIAQTFGLQEGRTYPFDFFFAERHTTNSRIKITTNLFTPFANLRLYPKPGAPDQDGNMPIRNGDTISAGVAYSVFGHAFDTLGWRQDWDKLIKLELVDRDKRARLISNENGSISIFPQDAYGTITIEATFTNPEDPAAVPIKSSLTLFIGPGKAHHINIQNTPEVTNKVDDDHLNSIIIQENAVLYAVVRDSLGNFVRYADNAQWMSENQSIVTVTAEASKRYQGNLVGVQNGTTKIVASEPGLISASTNVTVNSLTNPNDPIKGAILDSAITRDTDGNGYLDRIELYFNDTVPLVDGLNSLFSISYMGTNFTVDSSNVVKNTNKITLFLNEVHTTDLQTDWKPLITILGNSGLSSVSGFESRDGAGPVMNKAKFYTNPQGTPDTIRVTISELVTWPVNTNDPNLIFRYYHNGSTVSNAFTKMEIIDDSTANLIVSSNIVVETLKDSIQLIASSGLTDKAKIIPHPNGRKAPVEWGALRFQFTTIKNWSDPQYKDLFLPIIKKQNSGVSIDPKKGSIVILEVKGRPLKPIPGKNPQDSAYGKVKIYDAVGNLIRKDLYVYKVDSNQVKKGFAVTWNIYAIFWDGLNDKGRTVGLGTYLYNVVTTDIENINNRSQFKIGVTR